MWWNEFSVALGAVLAWLPQESYMVLPQQRVDGDFVQFQKSSGGLLAELSLPGPEPKGAVRRWLSPPTEAEREQERAWADCWERLRSAGWSPPLHKQVNWWRELSGSATRADYEDLVAEVVRILTIELAVDAPSDLRYIAWQEAPFADLMLRPLRLPRLSHQEWAARQVG